MAVIDYRGFRIQAISQLPITKSSIVYGSNDGGKTVHNSDIELDNKIKQAATKIGLKSHLVGNQQIEIHTCCDLEGHKGTVSKVTV